MCQAERIQLVPKAGHKVVVEWDKDIWRPEVGQLQAILYGNCQLMPELPLVEVCREAQFASAVAAFAMCRVRNILMHSDSNGFQGQAGIAHGTNKEEHLQSAVWLLPERDATPAGPPDTANPSLSVCLA